MNTTQSLPLQCVARRAGFFCLLLIPLGVFGILYVLENIFVHGDIEQTILNISENFLTFKLSIVSALLIQLVNLAVVLYLYQLFKNVHLWMARVMVIFIIVAMPIAMLNELNYMAISYLISTDQATNRLISLFIELHTAGIQIAGIFWGLWLLPMRYLVYLSRFMPKWIGVLLIIGGIGYIVDAFAFVAFEHFLHLSDVTFMGELAMIFWLLFKGVDETRISS